MNIWFRRKEVISQTLLVCLLAGVIAQGGEIEDLSTCKLPNGMIELAEQGSPGAIKAGGYILTLADEGLAVSPWEDLEEKPKSMAEYVRKIRKEKTGDVAYSSLNGGTMVAMSGKMTSLGKLFLHQAGQQKLSRPSAVWGKEEKDSSGRGMPGAVENVGQGTSLLLETVDGNFALIRVVAIRDRSAVIQWVYQPDGSLKFPVPRGTISKVTQGGNGRSAANGTNTAKSINQADVNIALQDVAGVGFDEALVAHMLNRKEVIRKTMKLVAEKNVDDSIKLRAISILGELRAVEAVELLVKNIDYMDLMSPTREDTLAGSFPCTVALIKIGKPSVSACIDALGEEVSDRKVALMVHVMLKVEGPDISIFLLKSKLRDSNSEVEKANIAKMLEHIRHTRN